MATLQYQLPEKGGQFTLVPVPIPSTLAPNEVSIRTKAVGLNGLDWKSRAFGIMVQKWPVVLGVDASGIVEAVGDAVESFQPGDEVFSLAGMEAKAGAFQEVFTVPVHFVAKKPSSLTFAEAASIPIVSITAAAAVTLGLKLPLPHLDPTGTSELTLKSVLVLGGSSGVGAAAIQYLRQSLPDATILTTSSGKHHERLISLGATKAFERTAEIAEIKAATGGAGVDGILDSVAAAGSQPSIFDVLSSTGPKLYSQVMTGQNVTVPEGVTSTVVFGRQIFGTKGGLAAISGLGQLLENGRFQIPTNVEVVGEGFEAIQPALDRLMAGGVSGSKFVVTI